MKTAKTLVLTALITLAAGPIWAEPRVAAGLAAALQATLSQHPAVAGKRAEVAAKGYAVGTARAQRYPTLSAQAGIQDNNTQLGLLRGSQPVWTFGRIDNGIAYAKADLATDQADLLRVQRQLIDQTAVAYAHVLGARQRLQIAGDDVAHLEDLYQRIQRRERGQLASQADVTLARARLSQARTQQARYAGDLTDAQTDLRALTQSPVQADQPVPAVLTQLPDAPALEALAEAQSADMQLKARRVALAQADLARERTADMPTLSLQADRYFDQPAYGHDVRLILVLEGSLEGLGLVASGRRRAAAARVQAAAEDLSSTRNDLEHQVKTLETDRRLQQTLIDTQGQAVAELDDLLASYQRQYEAGSKSWLDLLNILREWTEQRLELAQANNDWLVYTLRLAALTGRLDSSAGIH
jgi:outer membrane protein, adhesin transport system